MVEGKEDRNEYKRECKRQIGGKMLEVTGEMLFGIKSFRNTSSIQQAKYRLIKNLKSPWGKRGVGGLDRERVCQEEKEKNPREGWTGRKGGRELETEVAQ